MYNKAIDILNIFNDKGYVAYIVGGYPRDMMLGINSNDIDICTNAKPKEIMEIFDTDGISDIQYGYVRVIYKNSLFDVTTFRKDIKYEDNRRPTKIRYIDEVKKDLLRRDFTINTMCIDYNQDIIDLLGAKKDIHARVIRTVGNPRYRLKEDSLRILRAIRFSSNLDFDIDKKTEYYIKKYGYLLKNLSGFRKREEIDKILTSKNREKGRELLIKYGLDKYLGLKNLKDIVLCDDIIGIWSQLELTYDYPFSKIELNAIKHIREMLNKTIDNYSIYQYGLYTSLVVASIKGLSFKDINEDFNNLVIHARSDIAINGMDIARVLGKEPSGYIKDIFDKVEKEIVYLRLRNDRDEILKYVLDNFKEV